MKQPRSSQEQLLPVSNGSVYNVRIFDVDQVLATRTPGHSTPNNGATTDCAVCETTVEEILHLPPRPWYVVVLVSICSGIIFGFVFEKRYTMRHPLKRSCNVGVQKAIREVVCVRECFCM